MPKMCRNAAQRDDGELVLRLAEHRSLLGRNADDLEPRAVNADDLVDRIEGAEQLVRRVEAENRRHTGPLSNSVGVIARPVSMLVVGRLRYSFVTP